MRCLRAIRGVSLRGRMRNEDIRQETKVRQLRYGHVKRRDKDDMIRWVAEGMETCRRPRRKPRKRWMDVVKEDGRMVDLDVVEESGRWKTITRRGQTGWWWLALNSYFFQNSCLGINEMCFYISLLCFHNVFHAWFQEGLFRYRRTNPKPRMSFLCDCSTIDASTFWWTEISSCSFWTKTSTALDRKFLTINSYYIYICV